MFYRLTQIVIFSALLCISSRINGQEVQWCKIIGTSMRELPLGICADGHGSLFTAHRRDSIIITKIDAVNGEILWNVVLGSGGPSGSGCVPLTLTTDKDGNVLVICQYYSWKISGANGAVIWEKAMSLTSIATDESGNFFGIHNTGFHPSNKTDIILNKFDGNTATEMWSKTFGGGDWDYPTFITIDKQGYIYFAATFEGSTTVGGYSIAGGIGQGNVSAYLCKIDHQGNVLWLIPFVNGQNRIYDIAFDDSGNLYGLGSLGSESILGTGASTFNIIPLDGSQSVIFKADLQSGYVQWGKLYDQSAIFQFLELIDSDIGGVVVSQALVYDVNYKTITQDFVIVDQFNCGHDHVMPIQENYWNGGTFHVTDQMGNIFVSGEFVDSISVNNKTIVTKGSGDMFIMKYTAFDMESVGSCGTELLEVFPNPVGDDLILKINKIMKSPYSLRIMDVSGKLIFETVDTESFRNIELESLSSGLYFVVLEEQDGTRTVKKLMKL